MQAECRSGIFRDHFINDRQKAKAIRGKKDKDTENLWMADFGLYAGMIL